jgi:TP901 family phage tail tape measure protein
MASDLELELQIRLNEGQVLDRLERRAVASGRKIEAELSRALRSGLTTDKIRIAIDTTGIKTATADMKLLNAELREASKSLKAFGGLRLPKAPVQSSGNSRGANTGTNQAARAALSEEQRLFQFRSAMTKQRIKEESQGLATVARMEKEVSAARLKGAGGGDQVSRQLRHQIQLQQESIRHAQTLAKIKASPISPQAAAQASQLAKALNQINLNRLRQEFAQTEAAANKSLSGMGKGVGNLAANLAGGIAGAVTSAGLGAIGSMAGGARDAVTGLVGDSASKALDYGNSLSMVKINTQATDAEMQSINATVLETSRTFGVLPGITANLALELGRMGVSAQQLPGYLDAIGASATATGEDINIAKDAIAQTKAVFSSLDAGDIGDILTVGANVSPEGFQGIAQALSYVGAAAVEAGVPLTDTIEQITLLQSAGFRSDRAGTALTALYTDIKENAGVIEGFGVEVFDSSGKLRDMTTIIAEVGQATKLMTDEQKAAALVKFDTNSTRALLTLGQAYDQNAAKVKEMRSQLQAAANDNVSSSQASKAFEDPKVKLGQLLARVDELQIKLGQAFMPAIDGALTFGNTLADALLENEDLFSGINQAAEEFKAYLEQNPGLVDDLSAGLGEVATVLGESILSETQELLNHLRENPEQITAALNQMVDFASSIGECVKFAGDLAAAFNAVTGWVASLDTQLIGITIKLREFFGISDNGHLQSVFDRMNAKDQGLTVGGGRSPSSSGSLSSSDPEAVTLALISALEAPTAQGRVDVATAVTNRVAATRSGEGSYGSTVRDVAFASGQFEPFFGRMASEVTDLQSAAKIYAEERGGTIEEAMKLLTQTLQDIGNPQMQATARSGVGGRTDFKGVSEYGNMVTGEDFLRQQGENFFHIASNQTTDQLSRIASAGEAYLAGLTALSPSSSRQSSTSSRPSSPPPPTLSEREAEFTITVGGQEMTMAEYEKFRSTGETDRTSMGRANPTAIPIQTYTVTIPEKQDYGASRDGGARQHAGQDFDISGADAIAQTILGGVIAHITRSSAASGEGSYGNVVEIFNEATGLVERIAEMANIPTDLKVGQAVSPGATVGRGESESGVFHYELRNDGNAQGSQGSGFQGSVDPIKTYERLGLATFDGSRLTSTGRSAAGQSPSTNPQDVQTEAAKKAESDRKRMVKEAQQNQDEATRLQRQLRDQQRESDQDRQRIALENTQSQLAGTPFEGIAQRQTQSFDLKSRYADQIDTARDELQDLETQRQRLEERKSESGIDAVIQGYDSAIKLQQEYIQGLDARLFMESKNLEATQAAGASQQELATRQEMAARSSALAARTMTLEVEAYLAKIKDPALQEIARSGFAPDGITNAYADEIRSTEEEIGKLQSALEKLDGAGIDMNSSEVQTYQENLANLRDTLEQLKQNQNLEIEVKVRQNAETIAQFREDRFSTLANSTAETMRRNGDNFGANRLQRAEGQRSEVLRYGQERVDLEASRSTLGDAITDEQIGVATAQHSQNLEGIADQYKTIGEAANDAGKEMVGSFLQSIAAGEDFGQALVKVLDQLTGTIANMLIELAKTEIFGNGVTGGLLGGGNKSGGGMGDVLGGLTSLLPTVLGAFGGGGGGLNIGLNAPLYHDGHIPNFATGTSPIESAFRRERAASRAEPYLAVLNKDEIVLSGEQSRKFMAAGLDRVVNLASGTLGATSISRGGDINIPLTINSGGDGVDAEQSGAFARGLEAKIRTLAASELAKAQRPNGQLWNRGYR